MKITAGSFGIDGTLEILENGDLLINSRQISSGNIERVDSSAEFKKSLNWIWSIFFGLSTFIATILFGLVGFLIGLLITAAGAYDNKKIRYAEIIFSDGKTVTVTGSKRDFDNIGRLYQMLSSPEHRVAAGFALPKKQAY